jgi:hypothetical protein
MSSARIEAGGGTGRVRTACLAGVLVAMLAGAPARAAPPNPFREAVGSPGPLLAHAHFASHHRDGYGLGIGATPLPWLQLEASAGYLYELSLAAVARVLFLPRRALTPFVGAGANRAVTKLDGGLRYTTVSAIGTVGLQARVSERWFVGLEIATLVELYNTAKVSTVKSTSTPADRVDVLPGGFFGLYFP